MHLTSEQIQAVKEGVAVAVAPPEVGEPCVLLRADLYQRVQHLLQEIDPREAYAAIDEAWADDWNDPKMAEYDDYEAHRK